MFHLSLPLTAPCVFLKPEGWAVFSSILRPGKGGSKRNRWSIYSRITQQFYFLGMQVSNTKPVIQKNVCTFMSIVVLSTIARMCKQFKYPIINKEVVVYIQLKYYICNIEFCIYMHIQTCNIEFDCKIGLCLLLCLTLPYQHHSKWV